MKGPRYMPGSRWTNIAFLQPFLKDSETIRECLHLQWKSRESGCRKLLWMPSRILITSFCQIQNAILNLLRIQTNNHKHNIKQTTQSCACNTNRHIASHFQAFGGDLYENNDRLEAFFARLALKWWWSLHLVFSDVLKWGTYISSLLEELFIQIIIFLFDRFFFKSLFDRNLKANILGESWRLIRMFGLS